MKNFVLSCCSTADLSKQHFEERNIKYVCFHYIMDGVQYPDDLGETMSFEEFYDRIATGAVSTTAQVNVDQFTNYFEGFLKEGLDILHISVSSGISGAYSSANIAKNELFEKYPERKIIIVDSLGASSGYGLLADMVADKRDEGLSIEECAEFAESVKLRIHHWFFSTDLTSYIRGGRVSKVAGFVGTLLGICPLLNMNSEGKLIPREKIRSKQRVIKEIYGKMLQHAENGDKYSGKCFMSNSACLEDAKQVASLIESGFKKLNGKVLINSVGTVIGSHTGCGTVALFFVGDERDV